MPKRNYVERADREVSIFDVLTDFFNINVPRSGISYKTYCPFAFEHEDGGTDKGFRTYPGTGTAYCFVMHGKLTPVRLIAYSRGWRYDRAARYLLDRYGLLHRPWPERWAELQAERSMSVGIGDPQELVAALHDGIRTHPADPAGGLSPKLSRAVEQEMDILDKLLTEGAGRDAVEAWFSQAKVRLIGLLDQEDHGGDDGGKDRDGHRVVGGR
jgi:hypothetical protein